MKKLITFDDVLIEPKFSELSSRKEVSISGLIKSMTKEVGLDIPIVAANMDTVCGTDMATTLISLGAMGCLHRFWSVSDNVNSFVAVKNKTGSEPWVSVGISENEKIRVDELYKQGATNFVIDVAHAAQLQVVNFYRWIKQKYPKTFVVVGNFGNAESIEQFSTHLGYKPDAIKVGIGPGSACTTRIKTGCGVPQLSAIMDCVETGIPIIADGGMRTSGDICKALAAGAKMVMLGGMLAGTDETPGDTHIIEDKKYKIYRGSASKESYEDQGKNWSCAEGETFKVPYRGSVVNIIKDIEGGIRSAFTYVGAKNLEEFQRKATFVKVSGNVIRENGAHGIK